MKHLSGSTNHCHTPSNKKKLKTSSFRIGMGSKLLIRWHGTTHANNVLEPIQQLFSPEYLNSLKHRMRYITVTTFDEKETKMAMTQFRFISLNETKSKFNKMADIMICHLTVTVTFECEYLVIDVFYSFIIIIVFIAIQNAKIVFNTKRH